MDLLNIWNRQRAVVISTSCGVVFGGLFGHVLDVPSDYFTPKMFDLFCGATQHLEQGKKLRSDAASLAASGDAASDDVKKRIFDMHASANHEFELAGNCHSALAKAYLGQAYCFGWGMDRRDVPRGLQLIREGWSKDNTLSEWIMNPIFCHP
jgi:hypothetical protein